MGHYRNLVVTLAGAASALGLLFLARDHEPAAAALLASVPIALLSRSAMTALAGAMLAGSLVWLRGACGGAGSIEGMAGWMAGSFSDFGAMGALAGVLAAAAVWVVAVPVEAACRRSVTDRWVLAVNLAPGPAGAGLFLAGLAGHVAVRTGGPAGWSVWQDTVAQFCLPAGCLASVIGQAAALCSRDGLRAVCWTGAACGGWILMAAGRADAAGAAAAGALALSQALAVAGWLLVSTEAGAGAGRWRRVVAAVCALGLAGLWPVPGSLLARWGLTRQMAAGGFGSAWDTALVVACLVSWLMAMATWLPKGVRALRK